MRVDVHTASIQQILQGGRLFAFPLSDGPDKELVT